MKSVQINHRLCLSCFISWIFEVVFFCRSPILDQLHYCSLLYYAHLSANQYSLLLLTSSGSRDMQ